MELKGIMSRNPKLRHRFSIVVVALAAFAAVVQAQRAFYERVTINGVCQFIAGTGTPESAVTGNICDLFQRSDGGTGTALYVKETGTGNTGWSAAATAAGTVTFTNKTMDAEATGNVITMPVDVWIHAARCDNGAPGSTKAFTAWNVSGTTDRPVPTCLLGTNVYQAILAFGDTNAEQAQEEYLLPSNWTGAVDVTLVWNSTATTGNVRWEVATACTAIGEAVDPAFNTPSTVTDAAQGTASRLNTATITGVTMTGCAAGEMLWYRIRRDPADAADTLGATANLFGVTLTIRQAL